MPERATRIPSYRLHKQSGRAVVTLGGRHYYLGRHGTPESRAEYDRLVAEWLATGRRPQTAGSAPGADSTVDELASAYLEHANAHYVMDGRPTTEPGTIRLSRTIDVDTSGPVWVYTPRTHKMETHGRERRIYLGPMAQAVLRPWLRAEPTAFQCSVFSVQCRCTRVCHCR